MGDLTKSEPDKKFMLACLSTLAPNHRFFDSGYLPPPRTRKIKEVPTLTDYDELFTGLPPISFGAIKKRNLKTHNKLVKL